MRRGKKSLSIYSDEGQVALGFESNSVRANSDDVREIKFLRARELITKRTLIIIRRR